MGMKTWWRNYWDQVTYRQAAGNTIGFAFTLPFLFLFGFAVIEGVNEQIPGGLLFGVVPIEGAIGLLLSITCLFAAYITVSLWVAAKQNAAAVKGSKQRVRKQLGRK